MHHKTPAENVRNENHNNAIDDTENNISQDHKHHERGYNNDNKDRDYNCFKRYAMVLMFWKRIQVRVRKLTWTPVTLRKIWKTNLKKHKSVFDKVFFSVKCSTNLQFINHSSSTFVHVCVFNAVCPSSCTYNMTCFEMRNFSPMDMFPMNLDMDFNPFVCASCDCPAGTSKGLFNFQTKISY